jgi:tryptophan synthase
MLSVLALESAHAIFGAMELAKTMKPDQDIVICLSGRGDKGIHFSRWVNDKDVQSVAEQLPLLGPEIGWDLRF